MNPSSTTVFALPDQLSHKAGPAFVRADEQHFADIARALEQTVADLTQRLAAERRAPARGGQAALDRDLEVHRLTARLRTLRRFGLDLCLGRTFPADGAEPVYVGRLGLTDPDGRRLLVDWRSPAAEPFFAATPARPLGLAARRRYRWTRGRITDYWDEVLGPPAATAAGLAGLDERLALDDDSAFVASLAGSRSDRMRDVLATLQADQDAVIRAGSGGALVVDGGPGTGKTVVALHRAAYLLHADPRLRDRRGGILFVGPHQPYLAYVADVLPGLGEEGVQTCTLRDLLPEGAVAVPEPDPLVARLKACGDVPAAVDAAVRLYEEPPATGMTVSTPWADLRLTAADWADAFAAPDPGTPHNEARDRIHDELVDILLDRVGDDEVPADLLRRALLQDRDLRAALHRAWPLLQPADVVADLWSVPAYLKACAPWLEPDQRRALRRPEGGPWTVADLPWLDAARRRLGDPDASRRRRHREAALAAQQAELARVVEHLVESDDSEMQVMSMLRLPDLQDALVDDSGVTAADPDLLAGPFAHVVVDEAQELTDAEWRMLLARCPSRSVTVVGDRAQARHGFTESWPQRLERVGFDRVTVASLTVNYRTPVEVMAVAEPVIRAAVPDANVPTSIRSNGLPVLRGPVSGLPGLLDRWLAEHADGTAVVIGDPVVLQAVPALPRVRSLTPELAKGLEFDLVVLVEPDSFGDGVEGAVDRYVAMTRATQQLAVLSG